MAPPRSGLRPPPPRGGDASGPAKPVPRRPPWLADGPRAGLAACAPAGVPQRLPLHPGRFLERHYLLPLALTQTEAARRLGISRRRLNELIQGHRSMTPDTAIRCALAFGLPVSEWLALQAHWDSHQAWKQLRHLVQPAPRAVRRSPASPLLPRHTLSATPPSVRAQRAVAPTPGQPSPGRAAA